MLVTTWSTPTVPVVSMARSASRWLVSVRSRSRPLPPFAYGRAEAIWLANDKFGIGRAGVASARKAGLDATYEHTSVTEKGQVETDAYEPPESALV